VRLVTFTTASGESRVGRLDGDDAVTELAAPDMLAWLRGDGHEETGATHPLAGVRLLAPVPEPPSVRDFFAFEGHVATGWRLRGGEIPPAWYEVPVFYFSNPASIHGPDEPVRKPAATQLLDFELEVAAVMGAGGEIAGFTLFNDWSARDVQRHEMTVRLGPAKGKDFASSLGPWLVTPDELTLRDGRLDVTATVTVNGEEITRSHAVEMHWTWDQLVAHAARDTRLRPGDVIGSGTLNGGCLLELGPLPMLADTSLQASTERYLEPGDVVELAADGLGVLRTEIV
jgi:2-keto-4-pentenoate hydratase/2-oxohepta-3-ene-1,7-dioic acid hydratase (catechol pathway)